MINRAVLTGRLTRDPELRYTTSGTAVVSFTLAVDRQFRNQNGDRDADFVNCVIWRKSAENFSNFTHKGSLVGVEGRIQTRNYENQQGVRVYVTEVVVENFSLLESRAESERHQAANGGSNNNYNNGNSNYNNNSGYSNQGQNAAPQQSSANNNNPFGNGNAGNANSAAPSSSANNNQADPFANNGDQIDISDDDLPF